MQDKREDRAETSPSQGMLKGFPREKGGLRGLALDLRLTQPV